jgi:hypothetical protein
LNSPKRFLSLHRSIDLNFHFEFHHLDVYHADLLIEKCVCEPWRLEESDHELRAVAIANHSRGLSAAREQWKNAAPQFSQHGDYLTWLNSLINGPYSRQSAIESVKPVLVSIDRIDDHSYVIVTIREYVIAVDSEEFRSIKATTSAIVLQEPQLVRLSIQRELRAPSDVEDVRKQIAAWSRAVSEGSAKSTRP